MGRPPRSALLSCSIAASAMAGSAYVTSLCHQAERGAGGGQRAAGSSYRGHREIEGGRGPNQGNGQTVYIHQTTRNRS